MDKKVPKFEVGQNERQSWVSLAMIWSGAMVCLPCLMIGGMLGGGLTLGGVAVATVIGYGIVCAYMCFMGMQGCDTGVPTSIMAAKPMGLKGSKYIISLLLTIACVGWFGIQANVCGTSFSTMMAAMTGLAVPVWLSSLFWGVIMLLTAVFGYNALKYLNYIAVPALILVLGYGLFATLNHYDANTILTAHNPQPPMPFLQAISLVVATFALGGVISGDYSRFAKNRGDVVKSTLLGVLPSGLIILALGALMSIVTGQFDITAVLTTLGLPAFGLIALILAAWTTNVTNAYTGGLATAGLFGFGEEKRGMMTAVAGMIGTLLAAFGFMNYFMDFLGILTAFIPPVAGVVIADYWLVGKGDKTRFVIDQDYNAVGIIAFIAGAAVAYITGSIKPFLIAPVNGIVISMICYVVLDKVMAKAPNKAEA